MTKTDLNTELILKELVNLTANLVDAVAPLIEATQQNSGPFGQPVPNAIELASELRSKASALRQQCLEEQDSDVGTETAL